MKRIAVCIATYRRPDLLKALLESIERLEPIAEGWDLNRIVVVDNDRAGSAEQTAHEFSCRLPAPLIYAVEAEPGISQARNRAVALVDADYVAFVDDDEIAMPSWLNGLIHTQESTGAPVVVGRVRNRFEGDPPSWFEDARLYVRTRLPEGAPMPGASSSNLLVDLSVREHVGDLFDPRFGLLGGSDRHLGLRLQQAELDIVHSAGSIVEETITPDRYSMRVLLRRWTRLGSTYVLTDLAVPSGTNNLERKARHAIVSAGRLTVGLGWFVTGVLRLNRPTILRSLELGCRGLGGLVALVGAPVAGYPRGSS
jgi:glycosyltransferase involved in cell wall biosynthesis